MFWTLDYDSLISILTLKTLRIQFIDHAIRDYLLILKAIAEGEHLHQEIPRPTRLAFVIANLETLNKGRPASSVLENVVLVTLQALSKRLLEAVLNGNSLLASVHLGGV